MKVRYFKNENKKRFFKNRWIQTKSLIDYHGAINTLEFDFTKRFLATGSSNGTISLWNAVDYKNISSMRDNASEIRCVFFGKKNPYLFSGGDDSTIRCWDIEYNRILRRYSGHFAGIMDLAFHPVLDIFFSCSQDNTQRIWDYRMDKEIRILQLHSKSVTSLIANTESPHLISGSFDKKISLWDLVSGRCYGIIKAHKKGIKQLLTYVENHSFLSLSSDTLIVWRKDGLILKKFKNFFESNICFSISKTKEIAIGLSGNWVNSFYLRKKKKDNDDFCFRLGRPFFETKKNILAMSFDSNGDKLLIAGKESEIQIFEKKWNLLTQQAWKRKI